MAIFTYSNWCITINVVFYQIVHSCDGTWSSVRWRWPILCNYSTFSYSEWYGYIARYSHHARLVVDRIDDGVSLTADDHSCHWTGKSPYLCAKMCLRRRCNITFYYVASVSERSIYQNRAFCLVPERNRKPTVLAAQVWQEILDFKFLKSFFKIFLKIAVLWNGFNFEMSESEEDLNAFSVFRLRAALFLKRLRKVNASANSAGFLSMNPVTAKTNKLKTCLNISFFFSWYPITF